jgi:hypothetical protein
VVSTDELLRRLGGGAIDPARLPADVAAVREAVETMALLWDADLDALEPAEGEPE